MKPVEIQIQFSQAQCPHCKAAMQLVRHIDLKGMPDIYISIVTVASTSRRWRRKGLPNSGSRDLRNRPPCLVYQGVAYRMAKWEVPKRLPEFPYAVIDELSPLIAD
jgi:hypothetical protein